MTKIEHFESKCVSTFEFDLGKARAPCQRYLFVVVMKYLETKSTFVDISEYRKAVFISVTSKQSIQVILTNWSKSHQESGNSLTATTSEVVQYRGH